MVLKKIKYSIRIIILLCLFINFDSVFCQNINFDWALNIGGADDEYGRCITSDSNGNSYLTGFFSQTIDFDFSDSTNFQSSNGYRDVYITKYNVQGKFEWVKTFGGNGYDLGQSITFDNNGYLYVTGFLSDTVSVNTVLGIDTIISNGDRDFFILKMDTQGDIHWIKSMGSSGEDYGYGIETDNNGNVLITGSFNFAVDFDPDTSQAINTSNGGRDVFLLKLDSNGVFLWVKTFGGSINDYGYGISLDNYNNIILTGTFKNLVDFDPSANFDYHYSNGGVDVFVNKFNSQGNVLWTKTFGGSSNDYSRDVQVTEQGDIYLLGFYSDSMYVDTGLLNQPLISNGGYDLFMNKLDSTGIFLWSKSYGGSGNDFGYSISKDSYDNIYFTGNFSNTVDFNPGSTPVILNSMGASDIFVKKISETPNDEWTISMGGTSTDCASSISVSQCGAIYITGNFYGTCDFNYDVDTLEIMSNGASDAYIQKINQCFSETLIDIKFACDSFQWIDGLTYTQNNFTSTKIYTSVLGCDSIIKLNLTVDSGSVILDTFSICQGDSILLGGSYQTSNGIYFDSLQTVIGCDSVLSTILSIDPLPNVILANFNPDILCSTASAVTLPIGSPLGGNYTGNGVVSGNFNPSFTSVGIHDIIYTYTDENSCISSDTTIVTVEICTDIDNVNTDFGIIIYPNPSTGEFTTEKLSDLNKEVQVKLLDATSKLILEKFIPIGKQKVKMDIRNYSKGVYYLQLIVDDEIFIKQILKN